MSKFLLLAAAALASCDTFLLRAEANEPRRVMATEQGVWIGDEFYGHDPMGRARRERGVYRAEQASPDSPEAPISEYGVAPADYHDNLFNEDLTGDHCNASLECGADICCGDIACGDTCRPCRPARFYAGAEYLYGWTKGVDIPALVTTSTTGTIQDDAGVLGLTTTTVLLGNEEINDGGQSGARFILGAALDDCQRRKVEFIYSFFGDAGEAFAASSDNLGILARPFYNIDSGEEDALLIGFPSLTQGTLGVSASSDFQSFELHCRQHACRWRGCKVELLAGYRAVDLDDGLVASQSSLSLSGATAGTTIDLFDSFSTSNTFHGGQVGFQCSLVEGRRWSYDCTVKAALGMTSHKTRIAGSTTTTTSSGSSTAAGGLLTQASNMGEYSADEFGSVSELGLTLRYRLRPAVSLMFGYNVVFWSEVLRAGEQIDLGVNPTQIPPGTLTGEARPVFPINTSSYWAQELRFGLESRF